MKDPYINTKQLFVFGFLRTKAICVRIYFNEDISGHCSILIITNVPKLLFPLLPEAIFYKKMFIKNVLNVQRPQRFRKIRNRRALFSSACKAMKCIKIQHNLNSSYTVYVKYARKYVSIRYF